MAELWGTLLTTRLIDEELRGYLYAVVSKLRETDLRNRVKDLANKYVTQIALAKGVTPEAYYRQMLESRAEATQPSVLLTGFATTSEGATVHMFTNESAFRVISTSTHLLDFMTVLHDTILGSSTAGTQIDSMGQPLSNALLHFETARGQAAIRVNYDPLRIPPPGAPGQTSHAGKSC